MPTHEEVIAAWQRMNSDERFRAMSYEEQQQTRAEWAQKYLPEDPAFTSLSPQAQTQAFRSLVTQPPSFAEESEYVQETMQTAQAVVAGDPEAARQASTQIAGVRAAQNAGPIYRFATNVFRGILGEEETAGLEIPERGSDEDKAVQYLRQQWDQADAKTVWQSALVGTSPFLGIAGNIASGRVAGQAELQGARAGGRALARTAGKTPFKNWLYGSAAAEALESGADALLMTANDVAVNSVEENIITNVRANSRAGNIALNLGTNFLGDMLFFTGLSLVGGFARQAASSVFRWRGAAKKVGDVDEQTFNRMVDSVWTGEEMSKSQYNSLPAETQRDLTRLQRIVKTADNLEDASDAELADMVALHRGYEIIEGDAGFTVRRVGDGSELPQRFTTKQKAVRGLYDFEMTPPEQTAKVMDASIQNQFTVEKRMRFAIGDEVPELDTDTLARTLTPGEGGRLNAEAIQNSTRHVVRQAGAGADVTNGVTVRRVANEAYWKMADDARVQGGRVYVPETIRTSDEMSRFLDRYVVDVGKLTPEGTQSVRRIVSDVAERAAEVPRKTNPAFIEATAVSNGIEFRRGADGFRVGDTFAASIEDAEKALSRQLTYRSDDTIREAFGQQFGFAFKQGEDGSWHVRGKQADEGGNILTGNHATLRGAADELYEKGFVPQVSQRNAANVIINETGNEVDIQLGAVSGPREFVRDYANRYFADMSEGEVLRKYGTNTIEKGEVKGIYRVTSPEWGVIKEFDSMEAANKFLTSAYDDIDDLMEMGFMKGVLDIRTSGGVVVTRELGQEGVRTFKSVDELRDYLKAKTPDPLWQKEISNVDQGVIDTALGSLPPELKSQYLRKNGVPRPANIGGILDYMRKQPGWKGTQPQGQYGRVRAGISAWHERLQLLKDALQTPSYQRTRRLAGETGSRAITDSFESMEKQMANARGMTVQAVEVIDAVGRFDGAPNAKRRRALREFLETDPTTWDDLASRRNMTLTTGDRTYLERFRKASDGLGKMFGVEPYKMISNYLPRIREYMLNDPSVLRGATHADEVLRKIDNRMADELQFFSKYLRATELTTFLDEADPQDILANYAKKGIKNMTLGRTYEQQVRAWKELIKDGEVPNQTKFTIFHYLESVMGMYSDEMSKMAEQSSREIAAILSKQFKAGKHSAAVKDQISTLHGFTIAALMSFRPWPVIRNMQQVWTTLAPMFGNSKVLRQMTKMGDRKYLEEAHDRLAKSGRLKSGIPVYGLTYEAQSKMGVFNKVGMRFYKNSDAYTRILADGVVRDTFTDAVAKLEAGTVTDKQFIRLANLHRLDQVDQQRIMELLRGGYTDELTGRQVAGGFEAAVDYYGDIVTREAFFAYSAGANPPAFNGMWGRLFGMFGHYPVYYAQTLLNGLKRGNLADKAQFVGRVAFNSAALWFAFEKVWGIRADDFIPWKTAFFSGGPYFNLLSDALSAAAGDPGSSFKNVARDFGRLFTPGSTQLRNTLEGLRLMESGDSYNGFLRLMSAPLAPDR